MCGFCGVGSLATGKSVRSAFARSPGLPRAPARPWPSPPSAPACSWPALALGLGSRLTPDVSRPRPSTDRGLPRSRPTPVRSPRLHRRAAAGNASACRLCGFSPSYSEEKKNKRSSSDKKEEHRETDPADPAQPARQRRSRGAAPTRTPAHRVAPEHPDLHRSDADSYRSSACAGTHRHAWAWTGVLTPRINGAVIGATNALVCE